MSYCHENSLPIVPQAGNTGLVGGSVPVFDEIILCTARMNQIERFDEATGVVVCQAGVVLETLDQHVAPRYHVPLDLGAKGSCQIGGNVSTNAGGSRLIRYGSLRGSVLGLEAVLPDGRVLDCLTELRKDNTGYDLKQLFIGAEGTLGLITKVAIACAPRSTAVDTVVLKVDEFSTVPRLLALAKEKLGEVLSAFEFMDEASIKMAMRELTHVSDPLGGGSLVLIECAGSDAGHTREKLETFLEGAMENGLVEDGVIAENETQAQALWELRESLPEAVQKAATGGSLKYDLSLPMDQFYAIIEETRRRVGDLRAEVVGYGHVGDGNLHLNVAVEQGIEKVQEKLEPWVFQFVSDCRGSVSAEHGIGVMKRDYLGYTKSDVAVDIMKAVKDVIDERGICNPYKVLPDGR